MAKPSALQDRLTQAGVEVSDSGRPTTSQVPWFVRALQAFSGWLAALFLLGFIGLAAIPLLESTPASLSLGCVMLGAAWAILRVAHSDVTEHLALAISLTGQLLVAWAFANVWGETVYLWWALLGLQCGLSLVMPSQSHRGLSAFAASVALYMALSASALETIANGLVLLSLTALWINEFRWPGRIQHVHAWAGGLLVGLLVLQGLAHAGPSLMWVENGPGRALAGLAPWLNAALVALALGLLLRTLVQTPRTLRARLAAYVGAAALVIVSFFAPSVGQGVVVMLLGVATGHRLLVGVGVFALLLGIGSYYYVLSTTLLTKSLTLLVIGGLLLLLRWGLRRWLAPPSAEPVEGSLPRDA